MNTKYHTNISRMSLINASANAGGNTVRAAFDLWTAGIKVTNCVLVEKQDGSFAVSGPKGKSNQGHEVKAEFMDHKLREEITALAVKVYEGFTGRCVAAE
ncbi:hypothetical protein [Salipiger thiooxidans]|uniref:hypothetical protein n=1 Tax=Salipiger thiooxidans TaxID=282683 RepID=UPI001CD2E520|nr:hypothetical protein [Salipiger thiooxidans]MCA0847205.1 hypothetical protein [Salipiger thiooxidans]